MIVLLASAVLALAQDNSLLLPTSLEEITLENVDRVEPLIRLDLGEIHDFEFSPDGTRIAVATDHGINIYNIDNLEQQVGYVPFPVETRQYPYNMTFAPDMSILIADKTIVDVETLEIIREIAGEADALSPDGRLYATVAFDQIIVRDLESDQEIRRIDVTNEECEYVCGVTEIAFTPNSTGLVYAAAE
ncbi:MAG: hypothetical protein CUN54_08700, partial [Phototrophicales bacterium]